MTTREEQLAAHLAEAQAELAQLRPFAWKRGFVSQPSGLLPNDLEIDQLLERGNAAEPYMRCPRDISPAAYRESFALSVEFMCHAHVLDRPQRLIDIQAFKRFAEFDFFAQRRGLEEVRLDYYSFATAAVVCSVPHEPFDISPITPIWD